MTTEKMTTEEIREKVRKCTVADRKKLSALIKKLAAKLGNDQFLNLINSSKKESDEGPQDNTALVSVGVMIFQLLIDVLEEETSALLADFIGAQPEDFLTLPLDTELVIIDEITSSEEFESFFTIASALYRKTQKFKNLFVGAKTK